MTQVVVTAETREVDRMIAQVGARLMPVGLRTFLRGDVKQILDRSTAQRFAGEGDGTVGKWQELKWITQQMRRSKGFAPEHPINVRTGELKNAALNSSDLRPSGTSGAELIIPSMGTSGELGLKFKRAQVGDPKVNTPRRPVLAITMDDRDSIGDALERFLKWP